MHGKRLGIVISLALIIIIVAALFASRGLIAKRIYFRTGRSIVEKMTPKIGSKYAEEFMYTLGKFWESYESELVSQNDMTDVMEHMRLMLGKTELTDSEVFNFIGYVSRIYTEAMHEHHQKTLMEMQEQAIPPQTN